MKLGDRSSLPQYRHTSFSGFAIPPDRSLPNERLAGCAAASRLVTFAGFFTVELRLVPSFSVDLFISIALLSRIGSCGHLLCSADEASHAAEEIPDFSVAKTCTVSLLFAARLEGAFSALFS
jgi:hypothetical protein